MILLKSYFIDTTEEVDVISIIHEINRTIREAGVQDGLMTVAIPAPGGAVTVLEPLPDIVQQFKEAIRVFPGEGMEVRNKRKEDISVSPRVTAAMIGKTLQVPIGGGKLMLGPREEVVLIDIERNGRRREFCVQIMGEAAEAKEQKGQTRRK
ncbi:MAG: YjbQ family protein [Pseudomonadota bacterium]